MSDVFIPKDLLQNGDYATVFQIYLSPNSEMPYQW